MIQRLVKVIGCALGAFAAAPLLSGCGTGTEPLGNLGQANSTPQLALPVADIAVSNTTSYNQSGSGTASDGFDLNAALTGQSIVAPADGYVVNIDTSLNPGFTALTIFHNVHLTSRISRLQQANLAVGTFVRQGTAIGISSTLGGSVLAHFTVFFDGAIVCPYSYLTSAAQRTLNTKGFVGTVPCLQ